MLLEADWVLPVNEPPLAQGAVLVTDGLIEAVGPALALRARYPGETVRGFPDCALLPGLVNVHTHLEYSAFRGFARPSGFGQWMLRLLLARRKLDADDWAASALWGAYECARSGVTCIADASQEGWTVARAAGIAGLRARVYLEVFGLDDAALPATMERLESRLERLRRECGTVPVVEAGLSPHAPYTVSARLYREAARFARRAGLRLVTHVAESRAEVELLARGTGAIARAYRAAHLWTEQRWTPPRVSPVEYVAGTGALGPEMLMVHAVQVDNADIGLLADSGAAVAHCPRSNLRLQCGTAPVADMMAAGVTVGLGTDSLASNDSLDMFAEMRAALTASRERAAAAARSRLAPVDLPASPRTAARSSTSVLTPAAVLRMATLDGARAIGWGHLVGSLEAGKRADVIAVRLPTKWLAESAQSADPVAALVEGANAQDVRMTMVEGRTVPAGGRIPPNVTERMNRAREKLGLRPI